MYYICYTDRECRKDVFETVDGYDAMQERVDQICREQNCDPEEIHVFSEDDEIR